MTDVGGGGRRGALPSQRLVFPLHHTTLPTEEVTIGETLRKFGYRTAWFGKYHLGNAGPGAHGYDEHDGPTGNADGDTGDPENPKDIFGITDRGIAFMEKSIKEGKPFYLQLWHYAVHGPVQSRKATEQKYAKSPAGQVHRSASFAGMTEDLDTGVGMILDRLEELSINDNTYVVYMGDHGFGGGTSNSPLNQGKGTLWEGGMRVPLIIAGPNVKQGIFCDVPTVGWDLFPTFCELAGINAPLPRGVEGVSLKPLFQSGRGAVNRPGKHIAFHFPHYKRTPPHSTITRDGFKLMKFYDPQEVRLFNLNQDIGEQNNLAEHDPERASQLERQLDEYLNLIDASLPTLNPNFDPTAIAEGGVRPQGGARPQGRGRRGPRQAQLAERQKRLTELRSAVQQEDLNKIGQLINDWKKNTSDTNRRPPRAPRPAGTEEGTSPRELLQKQLAQLEKAHRQGDLKQIRTLVDAISERMSNARDGRGEPQRLRPSVERQEN